MSNKKQVLFVGSFIESGKSGNVGGQMFACRSLINSEISEKVDWTLDVYKRQTLNLQKSNLKKMHCKRQQIL